MPAPTSQEIQDAIEESVLDGLDAEDGDWIAELPDGTEIEFRPGREIELCMSDEDGNDVFRHYHMRVVLGEIQND